MDSGCGFRKSPLNCVYKGSMSVSIQGDTMKITKEDVLYVADLARLDMDESDLDTFADQIGNILNYINTLNQIDTTGVPRTSHAISLTNAFREDMVGEHLDREAALQNAPEQEDGAFVVPKVVG